MIQKSYDIKSKYQTLTLNELTLVLAKESKVLTLKTSDRLVWRVLYFLLPDCLRTCSCVSLVADNVERKIVQSNEHFSADSFSLLLLAVVRLDGVELEKDRGQTHRTGLPPASMRHSVSISPPKEDCCCRKSAKRILQRSGD